MNQPIITTTEQLKEVLLPLVSKLQKPQLPPEAAELEVLRRKEYLTTEEVEKLYQLNANTLRKGRGDGKGPAYSKVGNKVLYSQLAVKKYLESRRQKTNDQP